MKTRHIMTPKQPTNPMDDGSIEQEFSAVEKEICGWFGTLPFDNPTSNMYNTNSLKENHDDHS